MLNAPLPRLSTDSIGGLSSPTVNWNHTRLRLQNLVFCGANACSDRKVMQLAGIFSNFPPSIMNVPIFAWTLPIVVDGGTDHPFIVGTAFPISNGVLVTAKHVLREFQEATESVSIDRTVSALQILPRNRFVTWRTTRAIVHKTADLAILFSAPNEDGTDLWIPSWTISQIAPREDEWVGAFGYVEGSCQIVSRNSEGGGTIEVSNRGQANFGVVKNVYLITTQAKRNLSSRSGIGGVRSAT